MHTLKMLGELVGQGLRGVMFEINLVKLNFSFLQFLQFFKCAFYFFREEDLVFNPSRILIFLGHTLGIVGST